MVKEGDIVGLSLACKRREWFYEVKHLVGKTFPVIKVEGEYITFLCRDGKGRGPNKEFRRWHKSNLDVFTTSLENK